MQDAMRSTTKLRQLLSEPGIIVAPGAYDCLTASLIEQAGFPACYMTGAGTSVAQLGYPDLGLATMSEMVRAASLIANTVTVPLIADADTGYGGVLNIQRTIREYERAGVAALQLEDQVSPKRCGHLDQKQVIATDDMVQKVRAAVDARSDDDFVIIVRTDALAVTGWDDAMARTQAYADAGADVLFIEALRSKEQARTAVDQFSLPLLYNFVETGKSPLLSASELDELGFKIVIFPATAFLSAAKAVRNVLQVLKDQGTTADAMDDMVTLHDAFEVVGLSRMLEEDGRYA
jgi:methylisocitrate lyase